MKVHHLTARMSGVCEEKNYLEDHSTIPWLSGKSPRRIAIVGDLILDEYLEGAVHRISPEAPVPIHLVNETHCTLGGAGNTARNIALTGGKAFLFSITGNDASKEELFQLLKKDGIVTKGVITSDDRPTTKKTRITSKNHQLLRIDWERAHDISDQEQKELFGAITSENWDSLLISDYAKGALPKQMLTQLIEWATSKKIPVIVDPKGNDFSRYKNADLITPNYREACVALNLDPTKDYDPTALGKQLQSTFALKDVLVTMGPKGMMLVSRDCESIHRKPVAREVFDVSGAGDAVVAMMALSLACGTSYPRAMELANLAAGRVVEKWGTHPITLEELHEALVGAGGNLPTIRKDQKIKPASEVAKIREALNRKGKKVVFTNGCFDIFHAGHLSFLEEARAQGDILVVGVNSDASISRLKGESRPVVELDQRLKVLAGLSCIDYLVPFDEDTPKELIETITPDYLIKGADWKVDDIVGGDWVKEHGGEVKTIALVPGISTSEIISRILRAHKESGLE